MILRLLFVCLLCFLPFGVWAQVFPPNPTTVNPAYQDQIARQQRVQQAQQKFQQDLVQTQTHFQKRVQELQQQIVQEQQKYQQELQRLQMDFQRAQAGY